MRNECEMEHRAMLARFRSLSERWELSALEEDALIVSIDATAFERGVRLLLELDRIMREVLDPKDITDWLHDPWAQGLTPLGFLSQGELERSAMLSAARLRYREIFGYEA